MPYPPRPVEGRKWGENGEGKGKRKYERGREGKKRKDKEMRGENLSLLLMKI